MTRKAYRSVASTRWMTLNEIAAEIDRTPKQTKKLLDKAWFLGLRPLHPMGRRGVKTYPASSVEVLKAMLEIPHRPIPEAESDWLSRYEGEST